MSLELWNLTNMLTIQNEADYNAALAAIDRLMGAIAGSSEGEELESLVAIVEAYEAERWPVGAPDPISAFGQVRDA